MIANSLERGLEDFGTVLQTGLLLVREFRLQNIDDAAAAHNARQGQRHPKLLVKASDRNDGALILKHHLGDPDRYDSDTILTGIVTFDDSDVGVANLFLDSLSEIFEVLTALLEKRRDRHTTHTRR